MGFHNGYTWLHLKTPFDRIQGMKLMTFDIFLKISRGSNNKKSVSFRDVLRFETTYRKHEKRRSKRSAPPCASYEVRRSQFQYITKHNSSSENHWLCQKRNANYLCYETPWLNDAAQANPAHSEDTIVP